MSILVNLRHLESKNLVLEGSLDPSLLDLDAADELIHLRQPLVYRIEVIKSAKNLLAQGHLRIDLACECSRCLASFPLHIRLDPWTCHVALEGEEKVPVANDVVDLTPLVREDIVLAFPQQPLCDPNCKGLLETRRQREIGHGSDHRHGSDPVPSRDSPWSALDKLDL